MATNRHDAYLQNLPLDWAKVPIEQIGDIFAGGTPSRANTHYWNGTIAWATPSDLTQLTSKYLTQTREYITEAGLANSGATLLPKGSLLVTTRATIGSVAIAGINVCTNQGFKNIVPNSFIDSLFYYYLLHFIAAEMQRLASGSTFDEISRRDFVRIIVPHPNPLEQHHVAQILDTIDTQSQETEQLIAKLKQMKIGLLHDLLTLGIDENGEVRDPVAHPEQFKEILQGKLKVPNEWKVYPLQKIAEIGLGVTLGRNLIGPNTIELPYLRVANVQDGYLNLTEMKTVRVLKDEAHHFLLQPGDVLMTEGGDFDKLGRGTVWTGQISPCLHQNHIFRVRTNSHYLYPEYLALVSRSSYGKHFFLLSSKQSTNLASINSTQLKAFPIPCPPKEEQERILRVLNSHDVRISNEEACLNKLKQVKKGLMQDLLTGRVRVTQLIVDELKDASLLRASNRDK